MNKDSDPFFDFVLSYYSNDPYVMLEKFSSDISDIAEQRSINWSKTSANLSLDSKIIRGSRVFGLEASDKGRMSVTGYLNKETTKLGNVVYYPVIRFHNFRKQFGEPLFFPGYSALWKEFKKFQAGKFPEKISFDHEREAIRIAKVEAENKKIELSQKQAIKKDWDWMKRSMFKRVTPCPYLSTKGLTHIHEKIELYQGKTNKGITGEFTAVVALDLENWCFGGLQRLYEEGSKVFRQGMNPNGKAWLSHPPVDGEDIYISEAFADGALAYDLTGTCTAAAFYADNIPIVASMLRQRFPNSKLIFIADNDQYSDPNKGVESCVKAINSIDNKNCKLCIPRFEEEEMSQKLKDLTDYAHAYGKVLTVALISDI